MTHVKSQRWVKIHRYNNFFLFDIKKIFSRSIKKNVSLSFDFDWCSLIQIDRFSFHSVDYATKRTPGRVLILICIIWITSILISSAHLFPIFRDKRGRPSDQCHLIGNIPFTIISTVGAFYIPLIGMCIIYWKIFQAARLRIRRRAFVASASPIIADESFIVDPTKPSPSIRQKLLNKTPLIINQTANDTDGDNLSTYSSSASHQNDYELKPLKRSFNILLKKKTTSRSSTSPPALRQKSKSNKNDLTIPVNTIPNPLASSTLSLNDTRIIITDTNQMAVSKTNTVATRKRMDTKRERKATKVLGVVMGCFILCWLPFFIEETVCGIFHLTINEKVISVLTWLGYLNSLLNPVIYTIFAPDFRQAFGKILFGRYRKRQRLKK